MTNAYCIISEVNHGNVDVIFMKLEVEKGWFFVFNISEKAAWRTHGAAASIRKRNFIERRLLFEDEEGSGMCVGACHTLARYCEI